MALTSAAGFSDYMETQILNWFKGVAFPAQPSTVYAGLFTTNPADTGTTGGTADGTEMTTSNGTTGFTGYARQSITTTTQWTAIAAATGDSTGQQISTTGVTLSWTNNGGSTVTVTGIGIYSALTTGNLLFYIALGSAQQVTNGATFSISAGNLTIQTD